MASSSKSCLLCSDPSVSQLQLVHKPGLETLKRACNEKGEQGIHKVLVNHETSGFKPDVFVHKNCRRNFIRASAALSVDGVPVKRLRSSEVDFDWKKCCFLCDKPVIWKNILREKIRQVQTLPIKKNLIDIARSRNDDCGDKVLLRLDGCVDLVAVEALYHAKCLSAFVKKNSRD